MKAKIFLIIITAIFSYSSFANDNINEPILIRECFSLSQHIIVCEGSGATISLGTHRVTYDCDTQRILSHEFYPSGKQCPPNQPTEIVTFIEP